MNTLLKHGAYCMIAMATCFLFSCRDEQTFDITGDIVNKVYINNYLSSSGVSSTVTITPASTPDLTMRFPIQCTRFASEDIRVRFSLDPSLTAEDYSPFPEGFTVVVDHPEVVIPKGAVCSADSVSVSIDGDMQKLPNGKYIYSVKMMSVSGDAQISADFSAVNVKIQSNWTNSINNGTTLPGGTAITPKSGWSATGIANSPERLFDANTATSSYASTGAVTPPVTIEIDMKANYDAVTGFRFAYSSNSYCMTRAIIYTKTETGDYEFQGDVTLTRATSQVIRFYQPVNARFIKLEVQTVYNNSYGLRITDFNAYR